MTINEIQNLWDISYNININFLYEVIQTLFEYLSINLFVLHETNFKELSTFKIFLLLK